MTLSKTVKGIRFESKEYTILDTIYATFGIYFFLKKICLSPSNSKFLKHVLGKFFV